MEHRIAVVSASFGAGHDGAAAELTRRLRDRAHPVDRHDFVDGCLAGPVCCFAARTGGRAHHPRTWDRLLAPAGSQRLAGNAGALTTSAGDAMLAAIGDGAAAVVSTYPVVTYQCLPGHGATNAEALDRIGRGPRIRHRRGLATGPHTAPPGRQGFRPAAALPEAVLAGSRA